MSIQGFYNNNSAFGGLTNTARIGVEFIINGKNFNAASSESLYQGFKGYLSNDSNQANIGAQLITDSNGYGSKVQKAGQQFNGKPAANNYHNTFYNQSEPLKIKIMYDLVKAKFTQHPALLKATLSIFQNGTTFFEDSPIDSYWGIGPNKNGENHLGKIINKLCQELQNELQNTNKIQVYNSFSQDTINAINAASDMIKISKEADSNEFIDLNTYNNLPSNLTIDTEVFNFENSKSTNNNQIVSSNVSFNNIMDLAKYCVDNNLKGIAIGRNKEKIEYESSPNGIFTVKAPSRGGRITEIKYNTKNNEITENSRSVNDSDLGKWAHKIIEHQINSPASNIISSKVILVKLSHHNNMMDLAKDVIKNEPNCKFDAESRGGKVVHCEVKAGQSFKITGSDHNNKNIVVEYDIFGQATENGVFKGSSSFGNWAHGFVDYAFEHPEMAINLLG